jgi:hypothetical protein
MTRSFTAKLLIAVVVSAAAACAYVPPPSSPEAGLESVNPPSAFTVKDPGNAVAAEYSFVSPERETEEAETGRHLPPPTMAAKMVVGSQAHSSGGTSLALK